jgi:hypothetical protein
VKIPNAIDGIPFEVRPVRGDPAEALRRAMASMNATQQGRVSLRSKPRPKPRRKAANPHPPYCECLGCSYARTSAQQGQLERRRRARPKRRTDYRGREVVAMAKAKRARLRRSDAYVHGSHPTPQGRYSDRELQALGEQGLALMMPGGTFAYPITGLADLMNALAAYKSGEYDRTGVRGWIVERAILLGLVERLPQGWATPKQKLHPNEIAAGQAEPGGTAASGGQPQ